MLWSSSAFWTFQHESRSLWMNVNGQRCSFTCGMEHLLGSLRGEPMRSDELDRGDREQNDAVAARAADLVELVEIVDHDLPLLGALAPRADDVCDPHRRARLRAVRT